MLIRNSIDSHSKILFMINYEPISSEEEKARAERKALLHDKEKKEKELTQFWIRLVALKAANPTKFLTVHHSRSDKYICTASKDEATRTTSIPDTGALAHLSIKQIANLKPIMVHYNEYLGVFGMTMNNGQRLQGG